MWTDVQLATVPEGQGEYGVVEKGAVGVRDGTISWVGKEADLDRSLCEGAVRHEGRGGLLTAGLIDCHTHTVFGGTRADEFEKLLAGERYEDIAAAGGGIRSTVRKTRQSSEEALFDSAARRLQVSLRSGVTTVEIKSGYGLDLETECRMLRVARELGRALPLSVRTTLLAAHAVPDEFVGDADGYVDFVVREVVPAVEEGGLADQIDAFVEGIAFTPEQARRVFEAGKAAGWGIRVHAEQLSACGGSTLAAELGATSADHLEYATEEHLGAMAEAGVAAVLLPGAYYALGDAMRGGRRPDVATMRALGVPIAVATDLNPGSSPLMRLTGAMNFACTLFDLRPHEALAGVTAVAARVLGLRDRGAIAPGLRADFALWRVEHPRELSYWIGGVDAERVFAGGLPVGS